MITALGERLIPDHIDNILGFVILLNLKHLTQKMTGISQECIRAPSKRGRYWEIHPRCPRDVPRAQPDGHLEDRGQRGWSNPRDL